ncbi:uncharacterized protein LOC116008256 [Ipomoea triloba]|uniref:uncharacterized protein LOC116008256 n=1 Tax=Ipomoea triloba TaxID=35885 RepID=UPI00125E1A95|nr:uncharacterized protein LOC116008256 [Ipomoea triloba]
MSEPYKTISTVKPAQVFLKKTIDKTKKFLLKTLETLKSFLFRGYKNADQLPQLKSVNRISDSAIKELDDFYRSWSQRWESEKTESGKKRSGGSGECVIAIQKNVKRTKDGEEERRCDDEVKRSRREAFSQCGNKGSSRSLAKKMEELEMMDMEDVDQVLDIEEVLHYYSRLNCPLYLDIVDTFFMDMYTEFSLPPPTISRVNSSRRSLGPIKL